MVSDTVIVMIIAMVMVTLRQSPVRTSVRTYLTRIGWGSFPADPAKIQLRTRAGSAVDTARLVPHDPATFDLDDPSTHLVHDVGVVRNHDDGGAGPVDPVQQP